MNFCGVKKSSKKFYYARFQEEGVSPLGAFYCKKHAIIPSLILLIVTFRWEYIEIILNNYVLIAAVLSSLFFWPIFVYINFFTIGSVNNLSFLSAFKSIINIPIFALMGILVNGDIPNMYILVALLILATALMIRPINNVTTKGVFRHRFLFVLLLNIFGIFLIAINVSLFRTLLQSIDNTLFVVGLRCTLSILPLSIFFLFKKISNNDQRKISKYRNWAYFIPIVWFIASIFEGYGYLSVPIYVAISITAINFLIDVFSDIRNHRIKVAPRTFIFVTMVLVSVILSVLSLN